MAHRHKHHKAHGGKVVKEVTSKVEDEAESTKNTMKHGGKVHKRKSGGRVPGFASGGRLDKRARGGGVGADKSPFSSAHIKGHAGPATHPHPHISKG